MRKRLLNLCMTAFLFAASSAAYALDKVDGVYQIGTADDLKEFAELVNDGETYACAVLTADIDKGTDGTMIGSDKNRFRGIFDGKGHTITVNSFAKADGQAIFRNIDGNALVQNLKVKGTITTEFKEAAGIAGWGRGTIRNCWVDLTVESSVNGDGTHAGIIGVADEGLVMENCLSHITIVGEQTENCGGLCGWTDGKVTASNCLVINDGTLKVNSNCGTIARNPGNLTVVNLATYKSRTFVRDAVRGANYNNYAAKAWGNTDKVTVDAEGIKSGKVCYQLNNDQTTIAWVQNLGEDEYPVPAVFAAGKKQVYASAHTGCNGQGEGEITYSNEGTVDCDAHATDANGVCPVCGHMAFEVLPRDYTDNSFIVSKPEDIDWLEGLNKVNNGGWFNISLANDVEYIPEEGQGVFNMDNWFGGIVDGRGHKLTFQIENPTYNDGAALFPRTRCTIKNIIIDGTVNATRNDAGIVIGQCCGTTNLENVEVHGSVTTTAQYAGTVTGATRGGRLNVTNLFSDADLICNHTGDNTSGGIIGLPNSGDWYLTNVIYAGNIEAVEGAEAIGGFAGWSSANGFLTNVAFLGEMSDKCVGDSHPISRNPGKVNFFSKFYYLNNYPAIVNEKTAANEQGAMEQVSESDVESGKLAFMLNGNVQGGENFYQVIGTDDMPKPFAKEGGKVYAKASSYRCDGEPEGTVSYINTEFTPEIPDHSFEYGFCDVCGGIQEDFMVPAEDGVFEVGTADELIWWSHYAAKVDLGASVRLTADIDMNDANTSMPYALIGNEAAPFYGSFDGQFHTISNLVINYPGNRGVGLIGVMNSRASKADGVSDDNARSAAGTYIKDVVMDETCQIVGGGYAGLVGMTAEWAGHVTFQNVGLDCDVTCTTGANAGGVLGCVMGSTCHITIDNCYMTGNVHGVNENGAFSGWLGSYAEIKNCYAIGEVEKPEGTDHKYFARYGTAKITNCYTLNGGTVNDADHFVGRINEADIETGKLCYLLNGQQFRDCFYYQNIGEDMHPVANPYHGAVAYIAEEYFGITDDNISEAVSMVQGYENNYLTDLNAYQTAKDEMVEALDALDECGIIADFADGLDEVAKAKAVVAESAKVYAAYKKAIDDTKQYLEDNADLEGPAVDALVSYLEGDAEENYDACEMTDEEIKAETQKIADMLTLAIAGGVAPGTDVTSLFVNTDFRDGWNGWTGTGTGYKKVEREGEETLYGAEAWSTEPTDVYQTAENLKPGIYMVQVNGAYRPQNNRYSYNYAAQVYANGVSNYLMSVCEDAVLVGDAIDGVNVNLDSNNTKDLNLYDDRYTTAGDDSIAFAVHGPYGLAIASNVGRYLNYVACEVGEDGKLTIGVKNPHSKKGTNEWTGFANFKVYYVGEAADAKTELLQNVLDGMLARAGKILNEYEDWDDLQSWQRVETIEMAPNYPQELKDALSDAVANAEAADDAESMMAAIKEISEIFQNIYAGKQAYINMNNVAAAMNNLINTYQDIIDEAIYEKAFDVVEEVLIAYEDGSYTLEQALNNDLMSDPALTPFIAPVVDGKFQISTPMQLVYFGSQVAAGNERIDALLMNDIDMTGINFTPIGNENGANVWFKATFDGQGHAISNLTIGSEEAPYPSDNAALFHYLEGGNVKNVIIKNADITSDRKFISGIAGQATGKCTIDNCQVEITMHSNISGDGTHAGVLGVAHKGGITISNCFVKANIIGSATECCGGLIGWCDENDVTAKSCVIIIDTDINFNGCNPVSRNNGNCSSSNIFYTNALGASEDGATKFTLEDEMVKSGEMAWKLNGSTAENAHWFQAVGKDAMPYLFGKDVVYLYGGEYSNEKPNPQLNAFAYALEAGTTPKDVTVSYTLNAEAKAVTINFFKGATKVASVAADASQLKAGQHAVTVANSELGVAAGTELSYEVEVDGIGTKEAKKVGGSYKVWEPYGMAVNNVPSSPGFGQLYVVETDASTSEYGYYNGAYTGYISDYKHNAVYAFTPDFEQILASDGKPGFRGGVETKKGNSPTPGSYQFDVKTIRVSNDGRVFVSRANGLTNSPIMEVNPADLDEAWSPVFTGGKLDEETGITYVGTEEQSRMVYSFDIEGEGENLKLWTLGGAYSNGGFNYTDYVCNSYNLGTAKTWATTPSSTLDALTGVYTIACGPINILSDQRGGLWYIQYRANPSEVQPSLVHVNKDGVVDYFNSSWACNNGGMTISADGSRLAYARGNTTYVVEPTYDVTNAIGQITLMPVASIPTAESTATSMAFDYAGNLYVASNGSESLSRYAVPYTDKAPVVTPAVKTFIVGSEDISDAINGINAAGFNTTDAIYNVAGQRVQKAQNGIFIQNGKKVAVK